jgi:hypothetical protein
LSVVRGTDPREPDGRCREPRPAPMLIERDDRNRSRRGPAGCQTILDRKVAAFLVSQRRWSGEASAVLVVAMMIGCCFLTYLPGGTSHMPTPWFYIPIILAGARFGLVGGAVAAIASGILAGPLMPADVATGTLQSVGTWGVRAMASW